MLKCVVVATLVMAVSAQQGTNRWVWSQRDPNTAFSPPTQVAQRRIAAIDSNNENWFKSISARSFPNSQHPANILDILKESPKKKQHEFIPSPPKDRGFNNLGQGDEKDFPKVITPGLFPYPFGAKPYNLGDGTSIGFAPHDTLPVSNGHSSGHFSAEKTPEVSKDERYTTLDKLNSNRDPVFLPDPHTYSKEILGGLHPDEVFYADNKLMIIKGGGFNVPYDVSNDIDGHVKHIKTRPFGNGLADAQLSEQPTNVRPAELFKDVPLPLRFINGDFATIVKSNEGINRRDNFQQNSFAPLHHNTGFQPIRRPHHYRLASSNAIHQRLAPNRDDSLDADSRLQTLENSGESMIAEASDMRPIATIVSHPHAARKREANPKVVQFHYQTRGSNAAPIVNYQVHNNGDITKGDLQITRLNGNKNSIKRQENKVGKPVANNRQHEFSELEDLSTPAGRPNPLVPTAQTPRLKPETARLPISLRGDTDVNFLEPRPRANPLAEPVTSARISSPLPTAKPINRNRERQPSFFVPLHQTTVTSRLTEPTSRPAPSVRRLRPQQRSVIRSNRRFMEPRRRRPTRQKSVSPRM